jgi:hypothetical protein
MEGIMKKIIVLFLLILLTVVAVGCVKQPAGDVTEDPPPMGIDSGDEADDGQNSGETGIEEDVPIHEYTDEEKALLSIDMDKIIFSRLGWVDGKLVNDLDVLKSKYPDLILISSTYNTNIIPDVPIESQKTEYWSSELAGFLYYILHLYDYDNKVPTTWMHFMSGQADALITGLIAPIEIHELMDTLGIPASEWDIGGPPDTEMYPDANVGYGFAYSSSDSGNSVFIVIPTPGMEEAPTGITITSSRPGFISPTDKLDVRLVAFGE